MRRSGCSNMLRQYIVHLSRLEHDVPNPLTKATNRIYGLYPLIQSIALRFVLLAIRPLDFQSKCYAIGQPHNEIGDVASARSLPQVVNLESKMIVLGVSYYVIMVFKHIR